MVGAYGTLGVMTRATFRLHPLPRAVRRFAFDLSWDGVDAFVQALRESPLVLTRFQVMALDGAAVGVSAWVEGSPEGVAASAAAIAALAGAHGARLLTAPEAAESEREALFRNRGPLAKVTFPPESVGRACRAVRDAAGVLVAEAAGAGLVVLPRADEPGVEKLAEALRGLGGSFFVLRGAPALKRKLNAAATGSALPLMRRVKQQFDPAGTLNPGRLCGEI
jgi:glycolate oxidase FAD binding subunit